MLQHYVGQKWLGCILSDDFVEFVPVVDVLISYCVGPERAACGHAGAKATPK